MKTRSERRTIGTRAAISVMILMGISVADAVELKRNAHSQYDMSVDVLHEQGAALLRRGDARAAVIKLRAAAEREPTRWKFLDDLVLAYMRTGEFGGKHDLQIFRREHLRKRMGNVFLPTRARAVELNDMGLLYGKLMMPSAEERCLEAAMAMHEKRKGRGDPSSTLNNLAVFYEGRCDYVKAEPLRQRLLAINEKARGADHRDTAGNLHSLAELYKMMGNYAKAEPLCRRALAIRQKVLGPEHRDTASSLHTLADIQMERGEYGKAEQLYQQVLRISEKTKGSDPGGYGGSLNNLAWLHYKTGNYTKAESLYLRALAISEKTRGPEHPDTAKILCNMSLLYEDAADFAKAEPLSRRALKIFEEKLGPENHFTGIALSHLAALYDAIGDHAKAAPFHERGLKLIEKAFGPNHPETARNLHNSAAYYESIGENVKAEAFHRRTLEIWEKVLGPEHRDTATAVESLAQIYDRKGDYSRAEPLRLRALKITEKALGPNARETANCLNNLGWHYWKMGQYEKAEPLFLRALDIREKTLGTAHPETAQSLGNVACAKLDLGKRDEAIAYAERARRVEDTVLANVFSFTNEQQRFGFLQTQVPYSLLATLGAAQPMAEAVLRRKGMVLDSLLEDRLFAESGKGNAQHPGSERLRIARQRFAQLENEMPSFSNRQADERRRSEQQTLMRNISEWEADLAQERTARGLMRRSLKVTVGEVRSALAEREALVEMVRYNHYLGGDKWEHRYGALLLTRDQDPVWVPLGSAKAIEDNVTLYQKSVRGKTDELTLTKVLQRLHAQLWAPLQHTIPEGINAVIISPDSDLNFISFATLLATDGRFLAQEYSIRYAASGRDLARDFKSSETPSMVVFADPDFSAGLARKGRDDVSGDVATLHSAEAHDFINVSLPPLPGTAREAERLHAQLEEAGWGSQVYLSRDATKAQLQRTSSPRILHLATHGFFLPDNEGKSAAVAQPSGKDSPTTDAKATPPGAIRGKNPMRRSGLALAGARVTLEKWAEGGAPLGGNDGIITAEEVGGLNLKGTWLVTLSACDTGSGEARGGEGVMGLRRGFIQAGAQNLLMTLWPISDETTGDIMHDFYAKAIKGGDAPAALAETQRDWLVKLRKENGLLFAVRRAGAFIMSSQGRATSASGGDGNK